MRRNFDYFGMPDRGLSTTLTTGCTAFGHPEFELETGSLPEPLVRFVVRYLERSVAKGTRFSDGEHIQLGCGVLRVGSRAPHLSLLERAPGTDHWLPGIARTTMSMYRQRSVVESLGLLERLDYPSANARAVICTQADETEYVGFVRNASDDPEISGWGVLCGDPDHDHDNPDELLATYVRILIERVELFELFVATPCGTKILRDNDGIAAILYDGEPVAIQAGSFLDELRKRQGWPLES